MEGKYRETAVVLRQEQMTADVYDLWLSCPQIASEAAAGQFVAVYCKNDSLILPRPISICQVDAETSAIRLVYRVVGKGTDEFRTYVAGDQVEVMGPLGNGFPKKEKKAFLIGGGIGIPPMLELARELNCEKQIILGYRDGETFLEPELAKYGTTYMATEDGSVGTKGNVLDAIRENGLDAEVIYACGPTPMLRAIKAFGEERGIETWLSLEEKMACGIGACLACVCKSKEKDEHTNVHNKRICKDGPVFLAGEVEL